MTIAAAEALGMAGLQRTEDHRYFWNGEGPIPSVTTIQKMLDKSDVLVGWAKREVAACAIRNLDKILEMEPEAAIKWLKTIPDYQRDAAADLGSRVHALAEGMVTGKDTVPTEEEQPFVDAYRAFLQSHYRPEYLLAEEMVANLTLNYAGTFDFIARLDGPQFDGRVTLVDIKTGSGIYPDTAIQLAAYSRAEFMGRPGNPNRLDIPQIEAYAVLHLRPEDYPKGYDLRRYHLTDASWQAFLGCKAIHDWHTTERKTVMRRIA